MKRWFIPILPKTLEFSTMETGCRGTAATLLNPVRRSLATEKRCFFLEKSI